MLTSLHLEGFKSFAAADLALGPFTVLVGANASGKSNLRDAFRFLHGVSRGYTLAEIIGEKSEEGVLQWGGIRGGSREAVFPGMGTFALDVGLAVEACRAHYRIEVDPGANGRPPRLVKESLYLDEAMVLDTHPATDPPPPPEPATIFAAFRQDQAGPAVWFSSRNDRPFLAQLSADPATPASNREGWRAVVSALSSMRFLDLSPEAMRRPSQPGQTVLGDSGNYLPSVLQAMCEDPARKRALVEWVAALTPMDAADFDFVPDPSGRVHLVLVEENGQRTSAHSASDGTLRFLAMLAALLGPQPSAFYFFEELDNGIHPARVHLVLQLIEQAVGHGKLQVVTTTHSPEVLVLLRQPALEHASLTYRLPGSTETGIRRLLDIPDAQRVIQSHDLWRLHAGGWFEDAMYLSSDAGEGP